ncbi:MAG TPA: hypothetical protein VKV36_12275 [Acidimicrobiales bacterium]|nr:hypothetical protein [Acidimicrobiales bacterium]
MDEMQEAHFTVVVHSEGGQLWAEVEELPGCFATGDNMIELAESLREALLLSLPASTIELREWTPIRKSEGADREDLRVLVGASA